MTQINFRKKIGGALALVLALTMLFGNTTFAAGRIARGNVTIYLSDDDSYIRDDVGDLSVDDYISSRTTMSFVTVGANTSGHITCYKDKNNTSGDYRSFNYRSVDPVFPDTTNGDNYYIIERISDYPILREATPPASAFVVNDTPSSEGSKGSGNADAEEKTIDPEMLEMIQLSEASHAVAATFAAEKSQKTDSNNNKSMVINHNYVSTVWYKDVEMIANSDGGLILVRYNKDLTATIYEIDNAGLLRYVSERESTSAFDGYLALAVYAVRTRNTTWKEAQQMYPKGVSIFTDTI